MKKHTIQITYRVFVDMDGMSSLYFETLKQAKFHLFELQSGFKVSKPDMSDTDRNFWISVGKNAFIIKDITHSTLV